MNFCSKCGVMVAEGTAFCGNCGTPVTKQEETVEAAPVVEPVTQEHVAEESVSRGGEPQQEAPTQQSVPTQPQQGMPTPQQGMPTPQQGIPTPLPQNGGYQAPNPQQQWGAAPPPVAPRPMPQQNFYQNNVWNNPATIPEEYRPISAWGYFGYQVLFAIPCLGFIFLLVFALGGSKNKNLTNFARSFFCAVAIVLIISAIIFVIAFMAGAMM